MRIKRAKANKKSLNLYHYSFGFREPYQILLDGNFIHLANKMGANIHDCLSNILFGNVKLMTTYCVYAELRSIGMLSSSSSSNTSNAASYKSCNSNTDPQFHQAAYLAKSSFEKRRCPHQSPISARECLMEVMTGQYSSSNNNNGKDKDNNNSKDKSQMLSNKFNYIIATQDESLRHELRKIPGVPLIYLNKSVFILEPPSLATLNIVKEIEIQKKKPLSFEVSLNHNNNDCNDDDISLKKRKRVEREEHTITTGNSKKQDSSQQTNSDVQKNKRRKAKGPNPLSCKKKKSTKPVSVSHSPC